MIVYDKIKNMKLETDVEEFICNIAKTANDVGIESFVIDEEGIRGMDEKKQIILLEETFDLEVPFDSLAIGDAAQFIQRYKLHTNNDGDDLSIDLDNGDGVKTITMKSKGLTIDYRCMKGTRITAPKKAKDVDHCAFELPPEAVDMIKSGAMTMKADEVLFVKELDSDVVFLQMRDINQSEFKYEIEGFVSPVDDENCGFANRYPTKVLLSVMKHSTDNTLLVGELGTLSANINKLNVIIAPRV